MRGSWNPSQMGEVAAGLLGFVVTQQGKSDTRVLEQAPSPPLDGGLLASLGIGDRGGTLQIATDRLGCRIAIDQRMQTHAAPA